MKKMNKLMMILLTSLSVSSAFGQYKDENLLLFGNFNEKWEVYKTMGIPFKYYDEEIEL